MLLDITREDIKLLNDTDLRLLVGLLCEAELSAKGLSTVCVKYGGNQNAGDGGLDVRVEISDASSFTGFIPRVLTGFQVKAQDMPPAEINKELRPGKKLRVVINDLAVSGGAYIIVSSKSDVSYRYLTQRKVTMRQCLHDCPSASNLLTDFYDSEAIATWVRSHPSLILWVREKIGKPFFIWKSYANWANPSLGIDEEYIIENKVRIQHHSFISTSGVSTIDGINHIREKLQHPGISIRIIGLSGVGKTRFVQALFDERIGFSPLNPYQVFYADLSNTPTPNPQELIEQLIKSNKPSIVVLDNCSSQMHNDLTRTYINKCFSINLITVEYDVRDDIPEDTEVYRIDPASNEIIAELLLTRHPNINKSNAQIIAEHSGGNFRIALALSKTIKGNKSLSLLSDADLFKRLFQQRNATDTSLENVAQVCSLVYSFNLIDDEGDNDELPKLAELSCMSIDELYKCIQELKRRELAQQRGNFVAILPHAISNRMAVFALQNIRHKKLIDAFGEDCPQRLLRSFSKRLSYLHEINEAKQIAATWLSDGGILHNIASLNYFQMSLFVDIASTAPEFALKAMEEIDTQYQEKFFSYKHSNNYVKILQLIAYDPELFNRSIKLLSRFTISYINNNYFSRFDELKTLFHYRWSGTQAAPAQRLELISTMINSHDEWCVECGLIMLDGALETEFQPNMNNQFGSRVRSYGWQPLTDEEYYDWFKLFVEYSVSICIEKSSVSDRVKQLLGNQIIKLIRHGHIDLVEASIRKVAHNGHWREGWAAIKQILRTDSEKMPHGFKNRLEILENEIRPVTLIDKARIYALSTGLTGLDLYELNIENDNANSAFELVEKQTIQVAAEISNSIDELKTLLPDLLSKEGYRGVFNFGIGLAKGSQDHLHLWDIFYSEIIKIDISKRHYRLLLGYVYGLSNINKVACEKILDETSDDPYLSTIFPALQGNATLDRKGIDRVIASLDNDIIPIWQYSSLAYRSIRLISENDIDLLARKIAAKKDGVEIALEIVHGYLFDCKENASDIILNLVHDLIIEYDFTRQISRVSSEYIIYDIIEKCYANDQSYEKSELLCYHISKMISRDEYDTIHYSHVLDTLASINPKAFLDAFLGEKSDYSRSVKRSLRSDERWRSYPLSNISDDVIIKWCNENPILRYIRIAASINCMIHEANDVRWSPLAYYLINNSPEPTKILDQFYSCFKPSSWSGLRSSIMEKHLMLITELKVHKFDSVMLWANTHESKFMDAIKNEKIWEERINHEKADRFEY